MVVSDRSLSVIIPVYNEEGEIKNILGQLKSLDLGKDYEIIVVDDGSTDNTYDLIKDSDIKTIRHPFRKGYGASIKAGLRAAKGDLIATIDADGQHDPRDIRRLLDEIDGYDMVVGGRGKDSYKPLWRQPGKKVISWLTNSLTGTYIPDINSGLRIFKKEVALKYLHLLPNGFSLSTTITVAFLRDGYNIKYLPIRVYKRSGKSTINLFDGFNVLLLVIRLLMLFSPLRIFLPVSLLMLAVGTVSFFIDLLFYFDIGEVTILLILTGLLLFFFGLVVDQMVHIRRELK